MESEEAYNIIGIIFVYAVILLDEFTAELMKKLLRNYDFVIQLTFFKI